MIFIGTEIKNGIYGEFDDNLDLEQNIYLSRLPVRIESHVSDYISKLLNFEKYPKWNNNMLMSGVKLGKTINGHSDVSLKGDRLYNEFIAPYWNGSRFKFYDTDDDFSDGKHPLTGDNLSTEITKGYSFIDINTHGGQYFWCMEEIPELGETSYLTKHANTQTNDAHSVVLSGSCLTNAFDSQVAKWSVDPCLSESLLRNPLNGVIGYWGSVRQGFYSRNNDWLGASLAYEAAFFKHLLSDNLIESGLNFAKVSALAKAELIPFITGSKGYANSYYWFVQQSLTPVGDPEMALYTDTPRSLNYNKSPSTKKCQCRGRIINSYEAMPVKEHSEL